MTPLSSSTILGSLEKCSRTDSHEYCSQTIEWWWSSSGLVVVVADMRGPGSPVLADAIAVTPLLCYPTPSRACKYPAFIKLPSLITVVCLSLISISLPLRSVRPPACLSLMYFISISITYTLFTIHRQERRSTDLTESWIGLGRFTVVIDWWCTQWNRSMG
ncbi:hypothetical protein DFP72DRAFT_271853 [Ephemerocybe angulata]|uniref:Uncharacterized protein n=1 Tax=Ephemerocybe angulata TaxID=980116 RepID=A0A8H6M6G3_9AGAR|nr:hypothetical protein DFP72DRAFT_271853 [Tulosesus angulatus]